MRLPLWLVSRRYQFLTWLVNRLDQWLIDEEEKWDKWHMENPEEVTYLDALILNSEGKMFHYQWEGGSTVNVWTHASDTPGGMVNFDAFTRDNIMDAAFHSICMDHMRYAEHADPRYTGLHTKEELLHGVA